MPGLFLNFTVELSQNAFCLARVVDRPDSDRPKDFVAVLRRLTSTCLPQRQRSKGLLHTACPISFYPSEMSVEELRARIVTLGSEIELQIKLLKKLESDKIRALRQLNAALDPVARLPLEISSEIFSHSLAASSTGKQDYPTGLLRICNAWTNIALSTPRLWTTVRIHFPCGDDFADVLSIWFKRARNLPLSILISLEGHSTNWSRCVSDVLWGHGGQLQHLEILDDDDFGDEDDDVALDDKRAIDLFGNTTLMSLPSLLTLVIRCQSGQRIYNASQICQLLHGTPNIVEFISDKVQTRNALDPEDRPLIVPTLRRVIFGQTTRDDDEILLFLALPALEALSLPMRYISGDDLVAFVERSAAPLHDLTLGWEYGGVPLCDCLRLIPTLIRFKMCEASAYVVTELFTALADSPSWLPNLRYLTIDIHITSPDWDWEPDISESSWRTLVRALSSRRLKQLYIVPVKTSPPLDVLASLRALVADGANMHVGTEQLNYIAG
ncbi:hypothetical protein C8R45DRAFT_1076862 [Mycena sanguinolenta]|nr:hypothetical protein C8R45DRAFT_1076862 [Mycena sanguinolenta]